MNTLCYITVCIRGMFALFPRLIHSATLQFVLSDKILLHSNLYHVCVCIILLSFTLFFSVIYSVTFPLDNIMLHYSFASEACLRCLPLHYIILQSDLINYILLHYSLFTLHYSFVSEVCLRCLAHYSLIYSVTFCYITVWSAPLHYATLQLCIRGVFAVFGSPFRHSGCIVRLLSPPPICSLDWTLQKSRVSLNGYDSNPVVCQPGSKQVLGIKME